MLVKLHQPILKKVNVNLYKNLAGLEVEKRLNLLAADDQRLKRLVNVK